MKTCPLCIGGTMTLIAAAGLAGVLTLGGMGLGSSAAPAITAAAVAAPAA